MKENKGWFKKGKDSRRTGFQVGHPSFVTEKMIEDTRKRFLEHNPMHDKKIKEKYLKSMEEKVWNNVQVHKKISDAHKGKKLSNEHKRKLSEIHKGKHYSPRTEFKKGMKKNPNAYTWTKENRPIAIVPVENTSIEKMMQENLQKNNIVFTAHKLINNIDHRYRCDIFIEPNIIIECDGNYWHDYPNGTKLDKLRKKELYEADYILLRFWESEINSNINKCMEEIKNAII